MTAHMSSSWSDLPFDLLLDISSRLHTGTDYVRFHAVCKPWRRTVPPPERRPAVLPLLLARSDITGHRKARCVFSSTGMYLRDKRWAISVVDGTAACYLISPDPNFKVLDGRPLAGPSAISFALPPFNVRIKSWVNRAAGMVTGYGTVFLHAFGYVRDRFVSLVPILAAILRPSDTAWTFVEKDGLSVYLGDKDRCLVAYHRGKIVFCCDSLWSIVTTQPDVPGVRGRWTGKMQHEAGKEVRSSYLMESGGELLWVFVQVNNMYNYLDYCNGDLRGLASTLFVTVYQLQDDARERRCVERDGQSLADRILFLGRKGSFAVDAAPFGIGGCAYFVDRRTHLTSRQVQPELCRVYRYCFRDGQSEFLQQLPSHWNDEPCLWLTPQPAIGGS